ncbi:hypothetical protein [Agromyces mangrovi Wang et al. 2018]|uniref:hypothetical protein n=1 Tax=Agromyces mangrovi TaxID=1858653 RepID=UPI002573AA46|nr:hypothetical protein [Agromyces mangrovi]BDZ65950.1 hypothetical protein GCM10025877_28880 [Agromyces mangrovi]
MTRHPRRGALPLLVLVAGLAVALSGCATAAEPEPQPSVDPPAASTAPTSVADPLESVTTVVVRPQGLDLVDDGGTAVATLSYDDEAAAIVETLSTVFGSDARVEEYPGACCEAGRVTNYLWDGFRVIDDHMGHFSDDEERTWIDDDGPDVRDMNVRVAADSAAVGGVALIAGDGFAIGDDLDALEGRVDHPGGPDWVQIPLETGPELGAEVIEGTPNAYSVIVQVNGPGAEPHLVAPVNLGALTL